MSVGHWIGRGKTSGAEVKGRTATVFRFRDGKVVESIAEFPTKDAALHAVGLWE